MFPGDPDDETSFPGSLSEGGDDESVEDTLARQQRWDDLVARLVERAESTAEPSDRVQSLLRAARVKSASWVSNTEAASRCRRTFSRALRLASAAIARCSTARAQSPRRAARVASPRRAVRSVGSRATAPPRICSAATRSRRFTS